MKEQETIDTKFELCNYPEQVLKIGRDFQNKDGFRGAHYDTVKLLCDTIENLSEQTKVKNGDCAKLRGAALAIKADILKRRSENCWYATDSDILEKIDAALAALPRNCDRFASAEEAWDAYDAWVESYRAQGKTEPFNEFGWLFAPAMEKEGGAK